MDHQEDFDLNKEINARFFVKAKKAKDSKWIKDTISVVALRGVGTNNLPEIYMTEPGKELIITSDPTNKEIILPSTALHKMIPSSLCRCTGKKDKFGNLIYEHDILDIDDGEYMTDVTYDEDDAEFQVILDKNLLYPLGEFKDSQLAIVGNTNDFIKLD